MKRVMILRFCHDGFSPRRQDSGKARHRSAARSVMCGSRVFSATAD